jgi:hypothetical protein
MATFEERNPIWAALQGTNIGVASVNCAPIFEGHLPSNIGAQDPALSSANEVVKGPKRDDIHDRRIENVMEYTNICMNFGNIG